MADDCPSTAAIARAADADVVVMNHHVLAFKRIPAILLAIDEAHELEDNLRSARSISFSSSSIMSLSSAAREWLDRSSVVKMIADPLTKLAAEAEEFLKEGEETVFHVGWSSDQADPSSVLRAAAMIKGLADSMNGAGAEEASNFAKKIKDIGMCAVACSSGWHSALQDQSEGPWALYGTKRNGTVYFHAAPADVSHAVLELQEAYPTTCLTSATMSTGSGFGFIESSLGLGDSARGLTSKMSLPSPFDLPNMGVTVIPTNAPDPKNSYDEWADWAVRCVVHTVNKMHGQTLVLSSSMRMAKLYGEAIRMQTPYDVRVQGELGRTELREWFTHNTEGVLVASRSFFQGIDVSGESCSCVIIDRVPFAPPTDPVEQAVSRVVCRRTGLNQFQARVIPKASMLLKQAAGRLIRSSSDSGVIVCLDRRVAMGRMSPDLLSSFPPFPVSTSSSDIDRYLMGHCLEHKIKKMVARRVTRGKTLKRRS
jgi:ATP-dependent DNA helicase DinG